MAAATISDVSDFQLAAGGEVQALWQQLPGHPAQILLGAAADGSAVMVNLSLAEAAMLAERLAELANGGA